MGSGRPSAVVVFDVGKTHVKLVAIDPAAGEVVEALQTENRSVDEAPYLHADVEAIFAWLVGALAELGERFHVEAIVPSAYGSTAALIGEDGGLVLPMMDYEAEPPEDIKSAYATLAPAFDEVCCPVNPGGLTLARQLFWQSRGFADHFGKVRWILPAAQYWAWRLTGVMASEVTSLGAQTQLWNPRSNRPSSLAVRENWAAMLPPLRKAYEILGPLNHTLAQSKGRGASPPVLVGVHDSNANYTRYLAAGFERFTLISSGTWLITFDSDLPLERLAPERDMVSNTDLEGRAVACTRFMGGREFFELAGDDGLRAAPGIEDVADLLARGTMALPSFTDSGGPFPGTGHRGRILGPSPEAPAERAALASLYVALMTSVDLDLLESGGDVVIDGSFAENRLFAGLLAALRPEQTVLVSTAKDGTPLGAALLWGWPRTTALDVEAVAAPEIDGLRAYARSWRHAAERQASRR
ncbi:MAG: FGGY family carbohydrate kinase [Alphaproteobacteria bacterium]